MASWLRLHPRGYMLPPQQSASIDFADTFTVAAGDTSAVSNLKTIVSGNHNSRTMLGAGSGDVTYEARPTAFAPGEYSIDRVTLLPVKGTVTGLEPLTPYRIEFTAYSALGRQESSHVYTSDAEGTIVADGELHGIVYSDMWIPGATEGFVLSESNFASAAEGLSPVNFNISLRPEAVGHIAEVGLMYSHPLGTEILNAKKGKRLWMYGGVISEHAYATHLAVGRKATISPLKWVANTHFLQTRLEIPRMWEVANSFDKLKNAPMSLYIKPNPDYAGEIYVTHTLNHGVGMRTIQSQMHRDIPGETVGGFQKVGWGKNCQRVTFDALSFVSSAEYDFWSHRVIPGHQRLSREQYGFKFSWDQGDTDLIYILHHREIVREGYRPGKPNRRRNMVWFPNGPGRDRFCIFGNILTQ